MKLKRAVIALLWVGLTTIQSFGQQKMTDDEILKTWKGMEKAPNLDSIFRFQIHEQTRTTLEVLLEQGIDTILVYTVRHPGSVELYPDSCSTLYPVNSYFVWQHGGKMYQKKINGRCETTQSNADDVNINFMSSNYGIIAGEFFMDVIYEVTKEGSDLRVLGNVTSHEPKYEILIRLGERFKHLNFTESELTDRESLFYEYNQNLTSYKLFQLVRTKLKD